MNGTYTDEDEHDKVLEDNGQSIISQLGSGNSSVVEIVKTENGYRFVECCDSFYGVTLNQSQMERLIKELQELAGCL